MSKPPRSPYPPDADEEEAAAPVEPADLVDVVVCDADWSNERALRPQWRRVELRRCRLTGLQLAEAMLEDVVFEECRIDLAALRHARLERVAFRDCRLEECDLYGAFLRDVLFERCELREATFSESRLERVELRGCDLAGLRGAGALRGARIPWHDVVANAGMFAAALGIEIVD